MSTQIKTWQIIGGKLEAIETSLEKEKRTEPYDLEEWIASNPVKLHQITDFDIPPYQQKKMIWKRVKSRFSCLDNRD